MMCPTTLLLLLLFFIEKEVSIYSRNKINNSSFSSGHSDKKRVCVRPIKINIKEEVTKYKSMAFILVTALFS